ncbi:unnamed protein product [Porites evermanni]|uniref:F5/8 type C domain-containing protein n=1 Tax=Porites evermanni TaxID=104178 RepID=A0ABN8LA51_9CNID|nr:unnamed protein product [Porites evermanni]
MESGSIPDNRITASSQISQAKNGRLNRKGSWCASTSDNNPYLEIDLQTFHIICAVYTQGDSLADNWVKTYRLLTKWLRFVAKRSHNKFCMRTELYGVKQKSGKSVLTLK